MAIPAPGITACCAVLIPVWSGGRQARMAFASLVLPGDLLTLGRYLPEAYNQLFATFFGVASAGEAFHREKRSKRPLCTEQPRGCGRAPAAVGDIDSRAAPHRTQSEPATTQAQVMACRVGHMVSAVSPYATSAGTEVRSRLSFRLKLPEDACDTSSRRSPSPAGQ